MNRVTLSTIYDSRLPKVLGLCPPSPLIAAYVNEACERLLYEGKWFGCYARIRICSTEGCITLPPQVATIEATKVCGRYTEVHDLWFQFLQQGGSFPELECQGTTNESNVGSCWSSANYRGHYPTFRAIRGTTSKLQFVCDLAGDVGKECLFLGYDANGNWIRTMQSGIIKDGEIIVAAQSPGATSTNYFSSLSGVQFLDDFDGQSWLYANDIVGSTLTMIGNYQYWEKNPSYPRYFFTGICRNTTSESDCQSIPVDCIVKLAFIPVVNATDYPVIQNIPALKEMCQAIQRSEQEPDNIKANGIIQAGLATAVRLLDKQLEHELGSGRRIGINIALSNPNGGDGVVNLI